MESHKLLNHWVSITLSEWPLGSSSLCLHKEGSSGHHSFLLLCIRLPSSMLLPASFLAVSISDVERIRKGQDSELLRYLVEEFPLEQGFTIVFHGRRPNLDLVANSVEEAQIWMRGLQLLVDLVASMDHQEQLDQYQPGGARVWAGVTEGVKCCRTKGIWEGCRKISKWCGERQGPTIELMILRGNRCFQSEPENEPENPG